MSQPGTKFFETLIEKVVARIKPGLTEAEVDALIAKATEPGPWTPVTINTAESTSKWENSDPEGESTGKLEVRAIAKGTLEIRGRVGSTVTAKPESSIGNIPVEDEKGNKLRPAKWTRVLVAADIFPMQGFTFLAITIDPSGDILVNGEQRGELGASSDLYFNHILALT